VQIQTDPRYTVSESGLPLTLRQTIAATRFSQIRELDAPTLYEKSGLASNTLVANIQIVMAGEIARAHRHSAAALRLIIEG
jgi:gentisate 1,2-dioxygenase